MPCSAIFSTFPTDRGMCCAFNMKSADMIFKGSRYVELIKKLQDKDKKKAFENTALPKWLVLISGFSLCFPLCSLRSRTARRNARYHLWIFLVRVAHEKYSITGHLGSGKWLWRATRDEQEGKHEFASTRGEATSAGQIHVFLTAKSQVASHNHDPRPKWPVMLLSSSYYLCKQAPSTYQYKGVAFERRTRLWGV